MFKSAACDRLSIKLTRRVLLTVILLKCLFHWMDILIFLLYNNVIYGIFIRMLLFLLS